MEMKYKLEIGLGLFLLLFFISTADPLPHPGAVLRRLPNLDTPASVQCIAAVLPVGARALFFSNPDGTLNYNAYNFLYTRAQYQLAPRIVDYRESASGDLAAYTWFLAQGLTPEALAQFAAQNDLRLLQTCDQTAVLTRARP
jgi:hypothetical protein